ncbi:MAG: type II toxin-antitoxin system VapC family toxin [Okeania sp. SIO3I5]|uniref:type II toxin-antitoxin system VapC family toxin n=1 Tax=Okeania sp. SIO3I5 TaxID=2607805 RepID=UPI0013B60A60|nr:type II toxin-antitoxin system VapC family toxin [Okeania sp. SIO3I5]NEQ37270.1 type II toxin-antitoxin system VapC family toxin [Okeania sp. SIO3I5]
MKVNNAIQGVRRLFLDTAPIIYYVENHPNYYGLTQVIFDGIDEGLLLGVTSPISLSECLVYPYKLGLIALVQDFIDLIVDGDNINFIIIDEDIGKLAAQMRARYNLSLPDALQIATAIQSNCDAFLTNDLQLKRVNELSILVINELTL